MVKSPDLPGFEFAIVQADGTEKAEYITNDTQASDRSSSVPRVTRYIDAYEGERVQTRMSIDRNFPHLRSCQGIRVQARADGKYFYETTPRTEKMRTELFSDLKKTFDHVMETVIRNEDGQRKTKTVQFQNIGVGKKGLLHWLYQKLTSL